MPPFPALPHSPLPAFPGVTSQTTCVQIFGFGRTQSKTLRKTLMKWEEVFTLKHLVTENTCSLYLTVSPTTTAPPPPPPTQQLSAGWIGGWPKEPIPHRVGNL